MAEEMKNENKNSPNNTGKKPLQFTGRIWILKDEKGNLFPDIDTDMIYHNQHLAITDIKQMGQYALGNLKGYKDFAKNAKPGDIVLAGKNFGAGSSRQQAVDCFVSLGISCVIAESFGAIYKRNAINSGFPILEVDGEIPKELNHLDIVTVDMEKSEVRKGDKVIFRLRKPSKVQLDIYHAGNIFDYAKNM
ncbi:MAG: 3-isopropylmalate dehydratase [Thermoplasmata archaeon]